LSHPVDQLQQDLQQLMNWSDSWQMPFNKSKCKVMHLGHNNQQYTYQRKSESGLQKTLKDDAREKENGRRGLKVN